MAPRGCSYSVTLVVVLSALSLAIQVQAENKTDGEGLHEDTVDVARIVGGTQTTTKTIPWQVYIMVTLKNDGPPSKPPTLGGCGGSIISRTWILTAAHCFFYERVMNTEIRFKVKRIQICAGLDNTNPIIKGEKPGNKVQCNEIEEKDLNDHIVCHPKYSREALRDYDIALIKLKTPLDYDDNVKPIALASSELDLLPGKLVIASGYGRITPEGKKTSFLHYVDGLVLLPQQQCEERMTDYTDRMICQQTPKKIACKGDSGGPVVTGKGDSTNEPYVQVGIVSYGEDTDDVLCSLDYPEAFTNVAMLRDWIETTIIEKNCPEHHEKFVECNFLAANGYCNEVKVFEDCKFTCACDNCDDLWTDNKCKDWAGMGRCKHDSYKFMMFINCRKTCNACINCKDKGIWWFGCPKQKKMDMCKNEDVLKKCTMSCTYCGFPNAEEN